MKKLWVFISTFLAGVIAGLIAMVIMLRDRLSNNTIEIKRPKVKNSPGGKQDFTSQLNATVKPAKQKRKEKRETRKTNKLIRKKS